MGALGPDDAGETNVWMKEQDREFAKSSMKPIVENSFMHHATNPWHLQIQSFSHPSLKSAPIPQLTKLS